MAGNINSLLANKEAHPLIEKPEELKHYLSPDEYNLILQTLQQLIDDYNNRIDGIDGVTLQNVIKSTDTTTIPSDYNVYTALRTLQEIQAVISQSNAEYLSKKNDDSAAGKITFQKGLDVGNYQPGFQGGNIQQSGEAELKALKLRDWLEVPELRYNRVEVLFGDKWRAPGGGIIESVDTTTRTITLKLEDGEVGAVSVNDLCFGIIHSMDNSENATDDFDDGKGTRYIKGFASIYFKVEEILGTSGNNQTFRYSLRPISSNYTKQIHPKEFMHFVAFGNTSNVNRQNSAYETRTYERFLTEINNWEYTQLNIAAQFGDLSNLTVFGLNMTGYSIYLNNVYFTGNIQQIKAPMIINGYWHTWNGNGNEWVNTGVAATEPGKGALELYLTNNSILLHDSEPIDYGSTVTHIHVYEGEIELTYQQGIISDPGKYTISVTGNNITPGNVSLDNIHGILSSASNITSNTATVEITVSGKRLSGADFTLTENQNIVLVHDGADGQSTEFIFKQTNTSVAPDPDPSILDAVQEDDFIPSASTGYPTFIGWSDDAKGIDFDNQFEWRAKRDRKDGVWGKFSEAKLISRWGKDGLDGDAFEYIFKRTPTLDSPEPSPKTIDPVQRRDFVPSPDEGYPTFIGWTDDFVGPTKDLPYSWICKRERIDGNWSRFTNPEIWSTYSIDGNSIETVYQNTNSIDPPPIESVAVQIDNHIPTGWTKYPESISANSRFQWESKREKIDEVWSAFSPPALHGVFGEDGKDIEFIFNNTETDSAPNIIYIDPDFNNRSPSDEEYLPGDSGTGSGWKDDVIEVSKEKPYLWVSKRNKVDGVWEPFKPPTILSIRGKDGTDYEYVFKLTSSKTPPPQLISSTGNFQEDDYIPRDENGIPWLDDRVSVSENFPYLWISQRLKKDGVWQPFSPPTIEANWAEKGEKGESGEMLEFWGEFNPTTLYFGKPNQVIAIRHGDTYYRTKRDAGYFLGLDFPEPQTPEPSGIPNYPWEPFGASFKSVATELLLAENANIANFIFNNQKLVSQSGLLDGESYNIFSNQEPNPDFIPNIILDGNDGLASFSADNVRFNPDGSGWLAGGAISWDEVGDASFEGTINATEGNLGTLTMQSGGYIDLPPTFTARKGRLDNTGLQLIYQGANSQSIEWYNYLGTFAGRIAPDSGGHLNLRSDFGVQVQAPTVRVGTDTFNNVLIGNGLGTVGFGGSHLHNISKISQLGKLTLAYTTFSISNDTTLQISTDVSLIVITPVGSNAGISHIFRTPGTTAPSYGDILYIVNYSDTNHITFRNDNSGNSNIRNQNGPGQWKLYPRSNATLIYYGYWHVHADASQT